MGRLVVLGAVSVGLLLFAYQSVAQQALNGHAVPATHSKLSEHNVEWVRTQPPQVQAEFLMGAAVNHDEGATELIGELVDGWRGKLKRTQKWEGLEETALYSNDLRVRAAAIDINLVVNNLPKTDETVSRLMSNAENDLKSRPWDSWELGMLANRGVQTDRVHQVLAAYTHDPDQQVRFWAVEGLAHIGTDDTIQDFLEVLHHDASVDVRERAGCSLAKSGMLTRWQRMKAVPGLLDLADDPALDSTTRNWVYQALREITDVSIANDPAAWRQWYSTKGAAAMEHAKSQSWRVLGNS